MGSSKKQDNNEMMNELRLLVEQEFGLHYDGIVACERLVDGVFMLMYHKVFCGKSGVSESDILTYGSLQELLAVSTLKVSSIAKRNLKGIIKSGSPESVMSGEDRDSAWSILCAEFSSIIQEANKDYDALNVFLPIDGTVEKYVRDTSSVEKHCSDKLLKRILERFSGSSVDEDCMSIDNNVL